MPISQSMSLGRAGPLGPPRFTRSFYIGLLTLVCLLTTSCQREESPAILRIFVNEKGYPGIVYSSGPVRAYSYKSSLSKFECQLTQAGSEPSVSLQGELQWKDQARDRALVVFRLKNTERVIVELAGMHADNGTASEGEANFRQEFLRGDHEFKRELIVAYTYEQSR
jgi:hypothetical protein